MTAAATTNYLVELDRIIENVIAPSAIEIDRSGVFPREAVNALGEAGLHGLISSRDVGGLGEGIRAAATVVSKIAETCGSTAMVLCMHYAAAAVIEAHGPRDARRRVATGQGFASLAFSETGSRSQFWVPLSTARADNGSVRLDASKSWVTSADEAGFYVWSSRPLAAEGASTLWLVPSATSGLNVSGAFDGLGLRGNCSSPITADGVIVTPHDMLGPDGSGFDVMVSIVLPYFQVMSAALCVGTMEAATRKSAEHVMAARFEHLDQSLGDSPVVRAQIARMRIETDRTQALLLDTLDAIESGRPDTILRVLEVKAAAAEAASDVTSLAMRVCGGAAFRKEVGVDRHFRDARAITVMGPTTDTLYDLIGKVVCGQPLF